MLTVHIITEPNKAHKAFCNVLYAGFNEDYSVFTFSQECLAQANTAYSVSRNYPMKDMYMVTVYDGPTKLFSVAGCMVGN
jgi:hypothetical protein